MQFKNPELLYALLLLVIPIIVHLFQLRKFRKTPFTNLKFLKAVSIQTRKSSKIKKWLVLFSRLLALACIILAFAQPYFTTKENFKSETETVLYIDNSLSLQAKGSQGELLKMVAQQLYKNQNLPDEISWFSNNNSSIKSKSEELKSTILEIDYSPNTLSYSEALLKAQSLFSNNQNSQKNLIWISDFQGQQNFPENNPENINITTVQLTPSNTNNLSVDSVYVSAINSTTLELTVSLSNFGEPVENVPIALFENEELIARTSVELKKNQSETATFEIEDINFNGRIDITDQSVLFDNQLFFNINKKNNIKVLSINQENDAFLNKIYTSDEFDFQSQNINSLDFNAIQEQNTIILNGLSELNPPLQNALLSFSENGGTLVIIPALEIDKSSYNQFLNSLNIGAINTDITNKKQITTIHFSHPIYQNVFENSVTNFQYPQVENSISILQRHTPVLTFEDNNDFLMQKVNTFLFTASLQSENSNFTNSPLVVPTFYRIAKQSLPLPNLYYSIGKFNEFAVAASLPQDHILNIKNKTTNFIPLQQNTSNKVLITTTDQPEIAGIYGVFDKDSLLQNVSYNYSREESKLNYMNAENWTNTATSNSIEAAFEKLAASDNISEYWKWFVIFALFFFIVELILLKVLK
ncbi:BatA domain-containing protein [Planktosalinus lacus]|uniref:Membrane protein n=1 Tax=Planktosalinus lacus TaxID=1526573 RepID=A0A8J2VAN9_9FLAO|nr:BatA domain-containing protein [Planktosalinus lacus]GGD97923.1 membrane protein [Planktosalinus lacus]